MFFMVEDLVYYNNPDVCLCTYIIEIKQSDHIQGDMIANNSIFNAKDL